MRDRPNYILALTEHMDASRYVAVDPTLEMNEEFPSEISHRSRNRKVQSDLRYLRSEPNLRRDATFTTDSHLCSSAKSLSLSSPKPKGSNSIRYGIRDQKEQLKIVSCSVLGSAGSILG
jgi:hypothetical protein